MRTEVYSFGHTVCKVPLALHNRGSQCVQHGSIGYVTYLRANDTREPQSAVAALLSLKVALVLVCSFFYPPQKHALHNRDAWSACRFALVMWRNWSRNAI